MRTKQNRNHGLLAPSFTKISEGANTPGSAGTRPFHDSRWLFTVGVHRWPFHSGGDLDLGPVVTTATSQLYEVLFPVHFGMSLYVFVAGPKHDSFVVQSILGCETRDAA